MLHTGLPPLHASTSGQNGNHGPGSALTPTEAAKILQKVSKFLDWRSRKSARLVCRAWKTTFDRYVGVRLQIDDRTATKEDFQEIWKWNFSRYIAIEEATIVSIMNEEGVELLFHRPDLLRVAKCNGDINPYWFSQNLLLTTRNLTRLVLCGRFILSQDLSPIEMSTDYQGHLVVPSLKCLHVTINYLELREQLVQTNDNWMGLELTLMNALGLVEDDGVKLDSDPESQQKLQLMMLRTLLDNNMSLLLNLLRSPKLQAAYIMIDWLPEFGFEEYSFDWKVKPLESFISDHRSTLRHLYLPCLNGKDILAHKEYLLPEHLDMLELSLTNSNSTEGQSYEFWEKMLLGQVALKELHLELNIDQALGWYKGPLIGAMLDQSQSTLTYVNLSVSNPDSRVRVLDGANFRNCAQLQTLIIQDFREFPCQVVNLPALPKSLVKLQIRSVTVLKLMEWEKLKDFRALEILDLRRISRADPVADHLKVNRFFKEVLRLPCLNSLKLHFDQPLVGEERTKILVKLLKGLRDSPLVSENEVSFIVMTPTARLVIDHFFELSPVRRADLDPWGYAKAQPEPVPTAHLAVSDLSIESNIFQKERGHLGSLVTAMILNS